MADATTRDEHLAWCKGRALEALDSGDEIGAISSMISDLGKHDGTRDHIGISLMAQALFAGLIRGASDARHWIEGFN